MYLVELVFFIMVLLPLTKLSQMCNSTVMTSLKLSLLTHPSRTVLPAGVLQVGLPRRGRDGVRGLRRRDRGQGLQGHHRPGPQIVRCHASQDVDNKKTDLIVFASMVSLISHDYKGY